MYAGRLLFVAGCLGLYGASCTDASAIVRQPPPPDAASAGPVVKTPDAAAMPSATVVKLDAAELQTPPNAADAAPKPVVAAAHAVDVVVITATQMTSGLDDKAYGAQLAKMLDGLRKTEGVDLRMALIAPREAMDGTFLSALDGKMGFDRFRAVDLGLEPSKGLIASIVLGCPESASDFPALTPNSTKGPVICGKDLAMLAGVSVGSLEHQWLWELEPLRGKLMDFFRPNARRIYVFVAGGGAGFLTPTQWTDLVAAQPQDKKPVVVSVAPLAMSSTGLCSGGGPDKVFSALAKSSGGAAMDFCLANWMTTTVATADIVKKSAP